MVSANTEKLPDPVFPIGAAYMAGVALDAGHEVSTLDVCFAEDAVGQLECFIEQRSRMSSAFRFATWIPLLIPKILPTLMTIVNW